MPDPLPQVLVHIAPNVQGPDSPNVRIRPTLDRLHTSRPSEPPQPSPNPPSPTSSARHYTGTGPSQVNWISASIPHVPSPLGTNAPRWPSSIPTTPYAHHLGHSVSSPSLLPAVAAGSGSSISVPTSPSTRATGTDTNKMYRHPSLSSNRSLQLDMLYGREGSGDGEWDESDRDRGAQARKPLSPILERTYRSAAVARRDQTSLGRGGTGSPGTPGTPASFDQVERGSTHSAFLLRPLRRSMSQTSTSSFRTTGSLQSVPPTLPQLDLRPPFSPTLPLSHHASRSGPHFSTVYEDGTSDRTGSFVTANSVTGVTRAGGYGGQGRAGDEESMESGSSHTHMGHPSLTHELTHHPIPFLGLGGSYHLPSTPQPGSSTNIFNSNPASTSHLKPNPPPPSGPHPGSGPIPRPSRVQAPDPNPRSSSFIYRRWRQGVSFGSTRPHFSLSFSFSRSSTSGQERREGPRLVQLPPLPAILFWAGFVAPWCWLIGGWLVVEGEGPKLPLWEMRRPVEEGGKEKEKSKRKGREKESESQVAPAYAPTASMSTPSLPPPPPPPSLPPPPPPAIIAPSTSFLDMDIEARPHDTANTGESENTRWWRQWGPREKQSPRGPPTGKERIVLVRMRTKGAEKWVVRCRRAAVVSGVLLTIGFIVAVVLVSLSK